MKKILLSALLVAFFTLAISSVRAQSYTNNFQSGNWLYYYNLCWGIGPNANVNYNTKVTSNGFNGTAVCETDNLGQGNVAMLLSPWTYMDGNDQITFTHAVPKFNGTRTLKVFLISHPSLTETLLWTYNYSNSTPQTSTVTHSADGIYRVKWEWTLNGGNSRGQLDNITIGGSYHSDPSNGCEPLPMPIIDGDGDGIADNLDAFPTDPYRAFINYFPGADTSTLVFEDLWPSYGDYDLNDMVVGYKFKVITNASNNVVEVFGNFILRATGASLANGFGFQFPGVNPSSVISTTGYNVQSPTFTLGSNGTENGHSAATFIVFDKAKRFVPFGNTIPGQPVSPPYRFNMYIKFMENGVAGTGGLVSYSTLNIANFNPFLVSESDRGKEVHLPGYAPTALANPALFGTQDDDTQPGAGKYYQSATNLPWALNISGQFDYPIEKIEVSQAYLHFLQWVQSNGNNYPDWYLDQPGYRDDSKIY